MDGRDRQRRILDKETLADAIRLLMLVAATGYG
jgi:hypothetical protein